LGETVYVRKVEKGGGKLVNVEIAAIPNVKDPIKGRIRKKKFFVIRSTELPPPPNALPFRGKEHAAARSIFPLKGAGTRWGSLYSSRP
jgi:hypothetical protein